MHQPPLPTRRTRFAPLLISLLLLGAPGAGAGECTHPYYWGPTVGYSPQPNNCFGGSGFRCYEGIPGEWYFQLKNAGCDPYAIEGCTVQLRVPLEFPGVEDMVAEDGLFGSPLPVIYWFDEPTAQPCPGTQTECGQSSICGTAGFGGLLNSDFLETWVEVPGVTCSNLKEQTAEFAIRAMVCRTACRPDDVVVEQMSFEQTKKLADAIGCVIPPTDDCDDCNLCRRPGTGGGNVGGGGGSAGPLIGKAHVWYRAGGAGAADLPGSVAWNVALGRHWSHSYAQRIVLDPDETHVWLVTERGTFREFGNLTGGDYETLRPSDEYRTLHRIGTSGWELRDLDGTVVEFDAGGLWLSTTDRNGNQTMGTYVGGELVEVALPDGRSEELTYDGTGKLATVTEIGTDATTERTWLLTWSGDDLVRIDQPDGTAWVMTYGDAAHPGYMTRLELEGNDDTSKRVETAWEYDADGNVVKVWRGDVSYTGGDAVDKWAFSFDDPADPSETVVTDPLGDTATYVYDRDPASEKPRLTSVEGDCPRCGLDGNADFTYGDASNPLLPTSMTDGNGNVTLYGYDANGRMTSRTEAEGTSLERAATWEYDTTYPGLMTAMEQPSVEPAQVRRTEYERDAAGNVTTQRLEGFEDGTAFSLETVMTYNSQGMVATVDPPGHGTADVKSYGYDASGLVMTDRTDPMIGTTSFGHDAFNRRTSVTDPNSVVTDTTYDELDRVTHVVRRGATPADDLDTESVHGVFGDLVQTVLPEGNVVLYDYDAAGRLISVERAADASTPGERSSFTLDGAGNRTLVEEQSWSGTAWVTQAQTGYLYSSRCHVDKVLHADSTVTEYAYDCNGNLDKVWDAEHPSSGKTATPTTSYAYDALDRLATVTRPWAGAGGGSAVTGYGYDVQDHLVSVSDAEGSETTFEYSDRDLLTEKVSPVSGTTSHTYDEHGQLTSTTDARPVTVILTYDALDRVTAVDYPTAVLDTAYVYDDAGVAFSKGRLTEITRNGASVEYVYDRYGRMTGDGELSFDHDKNGNRVEIGYPGGVTAAYSYDFADRPSTLAVSTGAGTTNVVSATGYLPSGPLATLDFGSGTEETRVFDQRYFPVSIGLAAARTRSWAYTTDAMGNVTEIAASADCPAGLSFANGSIAGEEIHESCSTITAGPAFVIEETADVTFRAAESVALGDGFKVEAGASFTTAIDPALSGDVTETHAYQDIEYFLTSADGAWGSLDWTYDEIGNRLSEARNGFTDSYSYIANGAGGNTALLSSITLGLGGTRTFGYTAAGQQSSTSVSGSTVTFGYDDEGRLSSADRTGSEPGVPFVYDGRGFLQQAGTLASTGSVRPTYDSDGNLVALLRQEGTGEPQRRYHVFYLAGRPVAQLVTESGQADRWWYLTTDHLGTPLVATAAADGSELWENRFEPFGEDPWTGTQLSALDAEMYLRFPGQWQDDLWDEATMGQTVTHNLYRYYVASTGRYQREDPVFLIGSSPYAYALDNPVTIYDPKGLLPPEFDQDTTCLICTVYAEARGLSRPCQQAVASVIVNRLGKCRRWGIPSDVCGIVSSAGQFDGYGAGNSNYSYCDSCDLPTGELAETIDFIAQGFPIEPRALWYGNNEPGYVRYFKQNLGLSPVDHPACPTFAFFEQVRDPFVRPQRPSFC